jgi:DNA mismatch endonuclease (patch repair protein)
MSRIRSRDTVPELALRRALHVIGLRFRLGGAGLPGKPDIVLPRYRSVVFVHGCFWHRHQGCKVASTPKSNVEFWQEKFAKNVARDAKVVKELQSLGWRVFTAWECELTPGRIKTTALRLAGEIGAAALVVPARGGGDDNPVAN